MNRRTNLLAAALFVISVSGVAAQTPDSATLIRVHDITGSQAIGRVVHFSDQSLIIDVHGAHRALPLNQIASIELNTGRHRQTVRGAVSGAVMFGAVTFALSYWTKTAGGVLCTGVHAEDCSSHHFGRVEILSNAAFGAAVGGAVGFFIRTNGWKPFIAPKLTGAGS